MTWSYHKLVAEFGEDIALELLQYMPGNGDFDAMTSHWQDKRETPYDEVHDECLYYHPHHVRVTEINLEVGVDLSKWRSPKKEST